MRRTASVKALIKSTFATLTVFYLFVLYNLQVPFRHFVYFASLQIMVRSVQVLGCNFQVVIELVNDALYGPKKVLLATSRDYSCFCSQVHHVHVSQCLCITVGVWPVMDRASCAYNSFQGLYYDKKFIMFFSSACYLVCDFNPSFRLPFFFFFPGFTGFHLQPEDFSEFPAFVALHPRPLLFGGTYWCSNCGCINSIDIAGCICLHISIYTHWMGNPFGEFSSSAISFSFLFSLFFIYICLEVPYFNQSQCCLNGSDENRRSRKADPKY